MNIHLQTLVFTAIAGFWTFWPPNPLLGTISACRCWRCCCWPDEFWMNWAFCFNCLMIVCCTPNMLWIIIHELGIRMMDPFCFDFFVVFISALLSHSHKPPATTFIKLSWDKSRGSIWTGAMWPAEICNKAMRWSSCCASRCHSTRYRGCINHSQITFPTVFGHLESTCGSKKMRNMEKHHLQGTYT